MGRLGHLYISFHLQPMSRCSSAVSCRPEPPSKWVYCHQHLINVSVPENVNHLSQFYKKNQRPKTSRQLHVPKFHWLDWHDCSWAHQALFPLLVCARSCACFKLLPAFKRFSNPLTLKREEGRRECLKWKLTLFAQGMKLFFSSWELTDILLVLQRWLAADKGASSPDTELCSAL